MQVATIKVVSESFASGYVIVNLTDFAESQETADKMVAWTEESATPTKSAKK